MIRHRDLPLVDRKEVDNALGFVRLVELVASVPLTSLGVLAMAAALALHLPLLAAGAGMVTSLILYAIWDDTRLQKSLDLLRRGDVEGAMRGLERVVSSQRRPLDQRQQARSHLASIAWERGDLNAALHWTQERVCARVPARCEHPVERWLTDVTEVQLLALAGRVDEARLRVRRLGPAPKGEFPQLVGMTTILLVAFVGRDPDGVADRVDGWEPFAIAHDGLGTTLALLAWVRHELGSVDRARTLIEHIRMQGDARHLARHYPLLWQWCVAYDDRLHYARG